MQSGTGGEPSRHLDPPGRDPVAEPVRSSLGGRGVRPGRIVAATAALYVVLHVASVYLHAVLQAPTAVTEAVAAGALGVRMTTLIGLSAWIATTHRRHLAQAVLVASASVLLAGVVLIVLGTTRMPWLFAWDTTRLEFVLTHLLELGMITLGAAIVSLLAAAVALGLRRLLRRAG